MYVIYFDFKWQTQENIYLVCGFFPPPLLSSWMEFTRVSPASQFRMRLRRQRRKVKRTILIVMTVIIMHMGLTPNPLPAVNLPIFLHWIILFTGANLVCIENRVMNAIKNLKGLKWVQEIQLVFSCMGPLVLQSSQVWWEQWPSEGRIARSSRDRLICFLICHRFKEHLPTGVAWHRGSIVYFHGRSSIMHGYRILHVLVWSESVFCGQSRVVTGGAAVSRTTFFIRFCILSVNTAWCVLFSSFF